MLRNEEYKKTVILRNEESKELDHIIDTLKLSFKYYTLTLAAIYNLPDRDSYTDQNKKLSFSDIRDISEFQIDNIFLILYDIADEVFDHNYDKAEQILYDLLKMYPDRTLPAWRMMLRR